MTYEVLGVASHSENPEQKLVVYKALYGEKELWVRPAEMFLEIIDRPEHNYKGPRFLMIEEK